MNTTVTTTGLTFGESIHAELEAIQALPIDKLDTRQGRLVELLVSIVNHETENGQLTEGDMGVTCQDYWNTLEMYAQGVGFKFLGAGHFSAAFAHLMLPKRVIKIGFKKEDSGAAYTAWCRANQGRAGVPTIHAVSRSAGCYTVVLDRLNEYEHGKGQRRYYEIVRDTIYGHDDESAWDAYSQDLVDTSKDIRTFFKGIARFDLHMGNVMVHPDTGLLVITDPVSFSEDLATVEAPLDFDELVKEIAEAHAAEFIRKAKTRHEWKHGGKILGRKQWRRDKKAFANRQKARAIEQALKDKQERDIKVIGRDHPKAIQLEWCFNETAKKLRNDILEQALKVRRSDVRLQHIPNRVAKVDRLLNNELLLENRQTPMQPSWGKLFGNLEAQAVGRVLRMPVILETIDFQ
ncbi:serine-threonine kinase [Yersinia phage vB_YpEc11]|uniref:Serine-threonine kinase n=1 Tax=Yersinia phage vB_YpEc11 TaxID=3056113 RepID=A0AA51VI88_9CAUD|nr:serine-threonine kinase [Yersinia phage vB_YpEc11]